MRCGDFGGGSRFGYGDAYNALEGVARGIANRAWVYDHDRDGRRRDWDQGQGDSPYAQPYAPPSYPYPQAPYAYPSYARPAYPAIPPPPPTGVGVPYIAPPPPPRYY